LAKRVLFVDDSKTVLATVELAVSDLVEEGQITSGFYSEPVEFFEKIESGEETYDLLFVDINMPKLNGLDLVAKIKNIEEYKQKPILVLTTENSNEMKQKGKELGVTGWIVKPFVDEKIVKAVKKVLGI
jgi:two-component system chemotaxis response regulator CheY